MLQPQVSLQLKLQPLPMSWLHPHRTPCASITQFWVILWLFIMLQYIVNTLSIPFLWCLAIFQFTDFCLSLSPPLGDKFHEGSGCVCANHRCVPKAWHVKLAV